MSINSIVRVMLTDNYGIINRCRYTASYWDSHVSNHVTCDIDVTVRFMLKL